MKKLIRLLKKALLNFILSFVSGKTYRKIYFRKFTNLNFHNLPNEEIELLLLPYFLNKQSIFFDIGANIGVYSNQASLFVEEENIYAFEPIPSLCKNLKRAFKKAGIFNIALTSDNKNSSTTFKIPVIDGKSFETRGTLNTHFKEINESSYELIEVRIDTLDNFISHLKLRRLDFIKIDVEGHEEEVIKGGLESISKLAPIMQIEIEQRHNEFSISRIMNRMKELSYSCYYLDPESLQLKELLGDPALLQRMNDFKTPRYINNFYFIPASKAAEFSISTINEKIRKERTKK